MASQAARVTVTQDRKHFDAAVRFAKALDGRYDPQTRTWLIPAEHADRIKTGPVAPGTVRLLTMVPPPAPVASTVPPPPAVPASRSLGTVNDAAVAAALDGLDEQPAERLWPMLRLMDSKLQGFERLRVPGHGPQDAATILVIRERIAARLMAVLG